MARVIALIICAFGCLFAINSCVKKRLKIACIGDSITKGYLLDKPEIEAYPAQLQNLLGDQYLVQNFGVNGATLIKNGALSFWDTPEIDAAQKFNPDVIIVMLGTNDSNTENWAHGTTDFGIDYTALIEYLKLSNNEPQIYLCTPAPAYSDFATVSDSVINQFIIPVIEQQVVDNHFELIDINQALSNNKDLFPTDGIHPIAEGAAIIASTIHNKLTSTLE